MFECFVASPFTQNHLPMNPSGDCQSLLASGETRELGKWPEHGLHLLCRNVLCITSQLLGRIQVGP